MIKGDYLIFLGTYHPALRDKAQARYAQLKTIFKTQHCLVMAEAALPSALLDEAKGAILGVVHGPDAAAFDRRAPREMAYPSWESILRDNKGDFLVVTQDVNAQCKTVARSAMGRLPCYYISIDGGIALSNTSRMLAMLGNAPAIDEEAMLAHLMNINARASHTCLTGLTELEVGHYLTIGPDDQPSAQPFWDPWHPAGRQRQQHDMAQAPSILRHHIIDATRKATARSSHILLGLSGGLDSSILAASLRAAKVDFSCFTLVTPDGSGDERRYARQVAAHLGCPLHEIEERWEDVDIAYSAARDMPRPVARCFAQSGDKIQIALAQRLGADAYMSGGGGDNSFCYVHSARPLADRLLSEGIGPGAWRTARDIALLTDSPQWKVVLRGVQRALSRSRDYRWPRNYDFLSDRARDGPGDKLDHPWLQPPAGELPGKAQHIAWILGVLNHIEGFERERDHDTLWPLLSQSVVQFCLSLPTWTWLDGGQNRIIARHAFSDLLPGTIINRRSKGSPDSFVIELFEKQRSAIEDHLCDGWLAAHGMIDVDAIAARCRRPSVHKDMSCWQLFRLVDAESWARAWT